MTAATATSTNGVHETPPPFRFVDLKAAQEEASARRPEGSGRDANGRFAKGNPGGPGNPFARRCAHLRSKLVEITDDVEFESAARAVLICAQRGDMAAAKLLFSYVLGKPAGVVDPDSLDQQEWQLYKQRPVKGQEFLGVLTNFPLDLAVYLLRAALPGMSGDMFRMLAEVFDKQKAREHAAKEEAAAPAPAAEPAREAPAEPETAEALRSRAEADAGVLEQLQAIVACLGGMVDGQAGPPPQPPSPNAEIGPVPAAVPPSTNAEIGPVPAAVPPSTNAEKGPAPEASAPSTSVDNGLAPQAAPPSTNAGNGLISEGSPPSTNADGAAAAPTRMASTPLTSGVNGPGVLASPNAGNEPAPGVPPSPDAEEGPAARRGRGAGLRRLAWVHPWTTFVRRAGARWRKRCHCCRAGRYRCAAPDTSRAPLAAPRTGG